MSINYCFLPQETNLKNQILNTLKDKKLQGYFSQLIGKLAKQTATAILNSEYTKFDALIKNGGCQITMMQVHSLFSRNHKDLKKEAQKLQELADEILIKGSLPDPIKASITAPIAKLLRFRLLTIVNLNESPCPKTHYTEASGLASEDPAFKSVVKKIIDCLQVEESVKAIESLQEGLKKLDPQDERTSLIIRALSNDHIREAKTKIVSLPLSYTAEASLKIAGGLVLIKNKLFKGKDPIEGALDLKAFFDEKKAVAIARDKVVLRDRQTPIAVIEGFVSKRICSNEELTKEVLEIGLMKLVLLNAALQRQYVGNDQSPLKDKQAQGEIEALKEELRALKEAKNKEEPALFFEIDHIFCASLKEVGP